LLPGLSALAQSGKTVHVPSDKSILEAIEDAGLVLSASEQEFGKLMLICVSRAKGTCIELDL
jgi:hypothetical protein